MKNKNNGVYGFMAVLVIWLSFLTTSVLEDSKVEDKTDETVEVVVNRMSDEVIHGSKKFEITYFEQVFRQQRAVNGPGHIFTWNGKKYTTDFKEEK